MPRLLPALAALALLAPLSACEDRAASPTLAERAAGLQAGLVDTLVVGGRPEAVAVREASGATFPLPFTLRVPAPMAVTTERTAAGETVRLSMGAPPADAAWSLTLLAAGTTDADALAAATDAAQALGAAMADSTAPATARAAFRTAAEGRTGSVWLGRHAGRLFVVSASAADAARAAFEPRAAYLLQQWRWTDDGSALGG